MQRTSAVTARARWARALLAGLGLLLAAGSLVPAPAAAAGPCGPPVTSVIACENSLPGDPASDWQITGNGDSTIQGFSTAMSVQPGDTVTFKINTPSKAYHIDILRLGYYQGTGARKIAAALKPTATLPQSQPACLVASDGTGLIDCGNWAPSATWTVPAGAVSGLYVAHLVRDDTTGGNGSQIPFVVRNDASHSDMLVQTSDTTWEAYNTYGGNSLYSCTVSCPSGSPLAYKGADKVSYDRPFTFTDDTGRANPYYAEYPLIRFLEANGYDVSYTTGGDVDRNGSLLLNHKLFISSGHDEYWSGNQRANVEAARAAGVNLAFFSGNEVFWKTRWESSIDGTGTVGRTLVTYKETHYNAAVDPKDPPTWTGTWRDPRFSPPADGDRPENALTGQFFIVNSGTSDIQVPSTYAKLRFWRNTAVATLASGQALTLAAGTGTLGYEWDEEPDNGFRPAGLMDMSSTTVSNVEAFTDYGSTTKTGSTATHHLTLYRAPSGALVFGSGTVQWSWGLDSTNPSGKATDRNMQQATVNLFADMGAQPYALISGLVAAAPSTDTTPPTSAITSPASGTAVADGTKLTISGTSTDTGGGVIAGVEVSTDGGATWHPAQGTSSWTYAWPAHGNPTAKILSRAVDDSGNLESPSPGIALQVNCSCSIWGANVTPQQVDSGDATPIEVGVKFRSDTFGTVSGVRFYKASTNTGTHIGSLWTAAGQLLARATFSGESASGWQQVNFSTPVAINPNTTYVASYYAPASHYSATEGYFWPAPAPEPDGNGIADSPPLHALRAGNGGPGGVYSYASTPTFPSSTFDAENYWVDVAFTPQPAPGQATGVTGTAGYQSVALTWSAPSTGGPATSYTITPYIGSVAQSQTTVTGSPAPTSATILGLANGTTYTFTVTASNPNGSGPQSPASAPLTPSATASTVYNGGFESALSNWTTGGVAPPAASTAKAHSGTGSALLGTVSGTEPAGDGNLSQTITVPASSPTLSFWYWPATSDDICSGSACTFDWQEAQIRSTSGAVLASVFKSNSNAQAWTQVTYNMSAFAGQTVVLWFNVHQDGASPADDTSMYLDDVSVAGSGPTAPGAPTGVSATAGNAQATVSWTAPSNGGSAITGYQVTPYVGGQPQGSPVTVGGSTTSTTIGGLTNGTAYTFTVTATNSVGTGPASAQSNAVTPATVPGAPTGVAASAGNAQATVSWTAPSNGGSAITGYTVTAYVNGVAQSPATAASGAASSATVSGLTNGTTYTFTVTAANAVGSGPASAQSAAVTPVGPPGAPTGVSATAGTGQATVSWTAPASNGGSAITQYTVTPYIGTSAQPQLATAVSGSPPGTSATVTGLTNGTAYTFVVTASNAAGTSAASAPSAPVTPTGPPGAPTGVSAGGGTGQATVSWTAPASNGGSAITSYTVTPYIGAAPQAATTVGGSATSATVTGLTNGTTYTFTVTATNAFGAGPESAQSNAVTPAPPTVPGAPTGVSAVAGNAQATVSWSAPASDGNSPITSYTVTPYIGTTPQTPATITGSPPARSATITGLTNGQSYTFTVIATNAVGSSAESAPSSAVTPATTPGAPTAVSAVASNAQATVSWTAPASNGGSAITSYTVTPYAGSTAKAATVVSGSATSATVTGLANGTTYTFTVTAANALGLGPASTASNAVTPATVPGAPTAVSAVAGNAQATVSWTAPASNGGSALTSYTVTPYVGTSAQPATVVNGAPPATSVTVTGLTNGTAYTFTVTATNALGSGPASVASNAVTPATAPIPAFVQKASTHVLGVTSTTVTPTASITNGNRLVVVVGVWAHSGPTAASVTDSAGNAYTEVQHFKASELTELSVWTAPITKGGGTKPVITVTPSARADVGVGVLEYSGLSSVAGTAVVDQLAQATGTTTAAATVQSAATPATTAAGELALGFYVDSGFSDTLTFGTGWTGRLNVSPASDMEFLAEDQSVALGATPRASAGTGASTTWLMSTVVFKHG